MSHMRPADGSVRRVVMTYAKSPAVKRVPAKRFLGLVMAAALMNLPAAAQTAGALKTGVDATLAPHSMIKLGGGLQGFNIDLGQEVARRMGKKLEVEATEFSSLIPGLNAGKYDFLLTVLVATPERA